MTPGSRISLNYKIDANHEASKDDPVISDKTQCSTQSPHFNETKLKGSEPDKNYTSIDKSFAMGFIMGSVEAVVSHPLWALKTRVQAKMDFTLNPRILYRGLGVHVTTSLPLDIIQVVVSRIAFERLLPSNIGESKRRLVAGFLGGAASALICCPADLIMTLQQDGTGFKKIALQIYKQKDYRYLALGLSPTILREGIFCAGVLGGVSILAKECEKRKLSEGTTVILSGVGAGTITTILSHPADVVKTRMQAFRLHLGQAIQEIYSKEGLQGFTTPGLGWRMARVSSAVLILGNLNRYLEKWFLKKT